MLGSGRDRSQRGCLMKARIPPELVNYTDMFFSPFIFLQNPFHPDFLFLFFWCRKIPKCVNWSMNHASCLRLSDNLNFSSDVMYISFFFFFSAISIVSDKCFKLCRSKVFPFNLFPELVSAKFVHAAIIMTQHFLE